MESSTSSLIFVCLEQTALLPMRWDNLLLLIPKIVCLEFGLNKINSWLEKSDFQVRPKLLRKIMLFSHADSIFQNFAPSSGALTRFIFEFLVLREGIQPIHF